jgi:large subunit ribosomal protein L5
MNPMQQVRIEKVTLNIGAGTDQALLEKGIVLIKNLTGIEPVKTKSEKRIPSWGVRPGLPVGCKLTIRGKKANDLLRRLIGAKKSVMKRSWFDRNGNLSFGIHEYIDIPDMEYSPEIGIIGFELTATVEKPGYRVAKRKIRDTRIGKHHRVKPEESIEFFKKEFGIVIDGEK